MSNCYRNPVKYEWRRSYGPLGQRVPLEMLEPTALKGARWVLRRGGGGNASSLSDNPRLDVRRSRLWNIKSGQFGHLSLPVWPIAETHVYETLQAASSESHYGISLAVGKFDRKCPTAIATPWSMSGDAHTGLSVKECLWRCLSLLRWKAQ